MLKFRKIKLCLALGFVLAGIILIEWFNWYSTNNIIVNAENNFALVSNYTDPGITKRSWAYHGDSNCSYGEQPPIWRFLGGEGIDGTPCTGPVISEEWNLTPDNKYEVTMVLDNTKNSSNKRCDPWNRNGFMISDEYHGYKNVLYITELEQLIAKTTIKIDENTFVCNDENVCPICPTDAWGSNSAWVSFFIGIPLYDETNNRNLWIEISPYWTEGADLAENANHDYSDFYLFSGTNTETKEEIYRIMITHPAINQPIVYPGEGKLSYEIDVLSIIDSIPWGWEATFPLDWNAVHATGIYVGVETWGWTYSKFTVSDMDFLYQSKCNANGTNLNGKCDVSCGASEWCDTLFPLEGIPYCAKGGSTAIHDRCSNNCQPEDKPDNLCRKSGVSDCTGASFCEFIIAGNCSSNPLKKCSSNCQEISSCGDGICNCGETSENCLQDCPYNLSPAKGFGWDYNLTKRCVKTTGNPGDENYYKDTAQCEDEKHWLTAVESEKTFGESCPGPQDRSFIVNGENSPVKLNWESHQSEYGQNWSVNMKTDMINYSHPCGAGHFTWFAFMDQEGPFPNPRELISSNTISYNDFVLPDSATRCIVAAQFFWDGKVHLLEVNVASTNWGDKDNHPGVIVSAKNILGGMDYLALDGSYFGYQLQLSEDPNWKWGDTEISIDWTSLIDFSINEGYFDAPTDWGNTVTQSVQVASEVYNEAIADLWHTNFKISSKDGYGQIDSLYVNNSNPKVGDTVRIDYTIENIGADDTITVLCGPGYLPEQYIFSQYLQEKIYTLKNGEQKIDSCSFVVGEDLYREQQNGKDVIGITAVFHSEPKIWDQTKYEDITILSASPVNHLPIGSLDSANQTQITGWAYDLNAGSNPIDVHIYIDGINVGSAVANQSRPDLVSAGVCPDPNHGFTFSTPTDLSVGEHTVSVYAINQPEGTNPELIGSPIVLNISSSDITPPIISNISISNITTSTALISFETNEDSYSHIEYGLTPSYGSASALDSALATIHSVSLSGLSADTNYHFKIISKDALENESNSIDQTFKTIGLPDTTPPNPISNLSVSNIRQTSLDLNWTSPGDDENNGTASQYDIRYSRQNLADLGGQATWWSQASQLTAEPSPLISGTLQSYTVVGLNPGTIYYFAMKTRDEVPNWSGLSNIKQTQTLSYIPPTCISFTYSSWSDCQPNGTQSRIVKSSSPIGCIEGNPILSQNCEYIPPICTSFTYSAWSDCQPNNTQRRTVLSSSPTGCAGGNSILSQNCIYIPEPGPTCTSWTYSSWGECQSDSVQSRNILTSSPSNCDGGNPILSQSCNYIPPTCTSFTYSAWSDCQPNGTQSRTVKSSSPIGCAGGNLVLSQSCKYVSPYDEVIDTSPPTQPSNFKATPSDSQITLFWQNPANDDFVRTIIRRGNYFYPLSASNGDLVYEGTKEEYIDTNLTNNQTYYYSAFAYDEAPNYSQPSKISATPKINASYPEQTLLKTPDSFKIYIIINQKKKWIPTPEVFETLGYQWTNITIIEKNQLTLIPDYEDNLIRAINDFKVYLIVNGIKRHLPNPEIFLNYGFEWNEVKDVNQETINQYTQCNLIKESKKQEVYYLCPERKIKRWLRSPEIFNSYPDNNWNNIQVISKYEMDHYPTSNLIKLNNDNDVYLIEGNKKRLIKTVEEFEREGLDWNLIMGVNEGEFGWWE